MSIRVLRLMEYIYEDVETMEKDMARWIHSSPNRTAKVRFKSCSLPLSVFDGEGV